MSKFGPSVEWIREQDEKLQGIERHIYSLYEQFHEEFDLHIIAEELKKPGARDFSNIRYNAMMKLVVMDVITDLLEIDENTKAHLCRATIIPNWDLHPRKRPDDYDPEALEQVLKLGEGVEFDKQLVDAAGPQFFETNRADAPDVSDAELLMLLVSDLVDEREMGKPTIMNIDSHIDFKKFDRPDLDPELYWERERTKDHKVIRHFFPWLEDHGELPGLILNHIVQKLAKGS